MSYWNGNHIAETEPEGESEGENRIRPDVSEPNGPSTRAGADRVQASLGPAKADAAVKTAYTLAGWSE